MRKKKPAYLFAWSLMLIFVTVLLLGACEKKKDSKSAGEKEETDLIISEDLAETEDGNPNHATSSDTREQDASDGSETNVTDTGNASASDSGNLDSADSKEEVDKDNTNEKGNSGAIELPYVAF